MIEHNINVSKYKPSSVRSYIKLSKELYHPRKGLKKIQNKNNNECLKRGLARNFHPADKHPARIRKIDEDFLRKLHFKYIKKITKLRKTIVSALVFFGYKSR